MNRQQRNFNMLEAAIPDKNRYTMMVLGSQQVGKSAIINRFLHEPFKDKYIPTIEDSFRKVYNISGESYTLEVVEVGGVDPNQWWRKYSLALVDLYVLLYSVDNHHSFERCLKLREEILAARTEMINRGFKKAAKCLLRPDVPLVIMANKADVCSAERLVEQREAQEAMKSMGNCVFFETSAKTNTNINEAFSELFRIARLPPEFSPNLHKTSTLEQGAIAGRGKGEALCALSENRKKPSIVQDFWFLQRRDTRRRTNLSDDELLDVDVDVDIDKQSARDSASRAALATPSRTAKRKPHSH